MNKAELQQVRDALSINRVMAKDANGNYTREVTPKLITDAIALIDADLARVVEPVAYCVTFDGKTPYASMCTDRENADSYCAMAGGTASVMSLYATPQEAEAQPIQAPEWATVMGSAYKALADVRSNWPNRHSVTGHRLLCDMRDMVADAYGVSAQLVQDGGWTR